MEPIDFGVTRLSIVPVRLTPSDQSEQVTQLLFGDHYEVLEKDSTGEWLRIAIAFDHYEGWIANNQHHSVSKEYYAYSHKAEFKIVTEITASILYQKSPIAILMGSIIPISSSELFKMEEQFAFNGEAKNLGQKREAEFVKMIALTYRNTPYLWGGKSPFGIDCSGFVQMVFKISGYRLLRDASQQSSQGKTISFSDRKAGDVAFFKNAEGKIHHVGILLDAENIIHASGKVKVDYFNDFGILHSETKVYTHELSHVKRILPES